MKTKELRIGNFVNIMNRSNEVHLPNTLQTFAIIEIGIDCKICDITKNWLEQENLPVKSTFDLCPIPLTDEWKEMLGFEYNGIDYWRKGNLKLDSEDRLHIIDELGYGIIIARCVDSVHKLQNIYFSLKGKELQVEKLA